MKTQKIKSLDDFIEAIRIDNCYIKNIYGKLRPITKFYSKKFFFGNSEDMNLLRQKKMYDLHKNDSYELIN